MRPEVLQRLTWNGTPKELGDLFVLHKSSNHRTARCQLMTHVLGWECRPLIGKELVQSKVCKSQDDVLSTGKQWKARKRMELTNGTKHGRDRT